LRSVHPNGVLESCRGWFAVFPDCATGLRVADRLQAHAEQVCSHASGRPWLVGQWADEEITLAEEGETRVALIGCCEIGTDELHAFTRQVRGIAELDRLGGQLSGSAHLAASLAGKVRVQGTVSGVRRIFHSKVEGVTVAANRADVLAWLTGASLNEEQLAAWLLYPWTPHPLAERCLWRGIVALPEDCYLHVDDRGRSNVRRWWWPPEPVLSLSEGAPLLRKALSTAVEVRTRGVDTVSCDLSGGKDSTSLYSLAARGNNRLVAMSASGADPDNEDMGWARRALDGLGRLEHHVIDSTAWPQMYDGITDTGSECDEPYRWVRTRARLVHTAGLAAAAGSRIHLTGHGGDEVVGVKPNYLHATVTSHPRVAFSHLQGYRARYHWPLMACLRDLADRRSYGAWLAHSIKGLNARPPPLPPPLLGWGYQPRLVPWATSQTTEVVRSLLAREAQTAEPLAATHGQHLALEVARITARTIRQTMSITAPVGVEFAAPYLDDRVLEVCLSVRLHERASPWQYKPLLTEALRGIVPEPLLGRATKGEFSDDVHVGLRHHRADFAALLDDPLLARLGLIDADALRTVCLDLYPPYLSFSALDKTLACETWLRALTKTDQLLAPPR
jgi:asparagine synthase (glutamine-hydrolysing)